MSNFDWINETTRTFLKSYLLPGETAEERLRGIAKRVEELMPKDKGIAERIESHYANNLFSASTPVWCNFGRERGLPVSCFGSYIGDSIDEIFDANSEIAVMSKNGGGTSGYFGDVRPRGSEIKDAGTSSGSVHFMELFEKTADIISQGSARRGQFAAYLPVEHPDILEFLRIRTSGHPLQSISFGVTITDEWMKSMIGGDIEKRKVWAAIIRRKFESGYPYITFIDNINNKNPDWYKDQGLSVKAQNLCNEICLHSSPEESFVCVLSSLNLEKWNEIESSTAIEDLVILLDAVNEEFVLKTKDVKHLKRAHRFAKRHRALGMGVMGWHSLLQKRMIPFESLEAKQLTTNVFGTIQARAVKASKRLAKDYGEPEVMKGYGRRNTHLLAIAPTASSSVIHGQVSSGIEPYFGNAYIDKTAKGVFTFRNPFLKPVLAKYGKDNEETWDSILDRGGSVQHLKFLSSEEKSIFKTFDEISQKEIVIQASIRQKFIDQGQSLNVKISSRIPAKEASDLYIFGWENGIKGFYYQRGTNSSQELSKSILVCESCSG